MATTNDIYAEMQRYAPLELAESWDNPGLLVDCAREVSRVLVTPAGAKGHLCHLYAHQSGCSRGRRERGAGGHLRDAGLGSVCRWLRPGGRG